MRYFKTETPHIGVQVTGGNRFVWLVAEDGHGYAEVEEEQDIKIIENLISRGIGGTISEIPKTEFEAVKKTLLPPKKPIRAGIQSPDAPDTTVQAPAPPAAAPQALFSGPAIAPAVVVGTAATPTVLSNPAATPAVSPKAPVTHEPEPEPPLDPKVGKRR